MLRIRCRAWLDRCSADNFFLDWGGFGAPTKSSIAAADVSRHLAWRYKLRFKLRRSDGRWRWSMRPERGLVWDFLAYKTNLGRIEKRTRDKKYLGRIRSVKPGVHTRDCTRLRPDWTVASQSGRDRATFIVPTTPRTLSQPDPHLAILSMQPPGVFFWWCICTMLPSGV